ncbi:MAG TPA: penicillin-binding transpeptidase domain-containing protein [Pyrinomonadaceae bacterium]|nr:penicillin-binding transpeptidase domain-containing protein [Pyrinomonadaceae bacterium]
MSRREQRRQSAREQSASLASLQRRLRRPLTKRERAAELRRLNSSRRRELLEARRRAEAARRAAIARQLALEKAMRDEAMSFISKDDTTGEDPEVRRVAVNALGYHAGTVVVMDPMSGKVYSIVNQEWALRRGFKPCSTIKLVTGVAGLQENMISPFENTNISDRYRIDLTDALAYSNNTYFQHIGGQVGFDKMMNYSKELGLGEKTGINVNYEYPGRLPAEKSGFALNRMSSHGDDFEVTPLQLGTLVSSLANGGKLLTPFIPRTAQDAKVKVRRNLDITQDNLRRMVPGMVGAVNYGSGKKAYDPMQTVAGKTGTCIQQGAWIGLFTSYAPLANPRLAVVVIARGSDGRKHFPAAVAGRIYRDLNHRFGTPIHLQLAAKPNDAKAAELNEEEKDAEEAEVAETEAAILAEEQKAAAAAATPTAPVQHPLVNPAPANSTVKRVILPVEPKNTQTQKGEAPKSTLGKTSVTPSTQPDNRPRKTQP